MIENNCSCSVLSNKIDKSIIRLYDNNKGRKRSGLDKSKLQAVEKAIESLAVQGFLPENTTAIRTPRSWTQWCFSCFSCVFNAFTPHLVQSILDVKLENA